jgi:hypothetical protein
VHHATMPPCAPATVSAAELIESFLGQGLQPGLAPWVRPEIAAIDAAVVSQARCPGCRQRGLLCRAFHDGRSRYRLIGECPHCGSSEEF